MTDHEPGCPLSATPWLTDAALDDAFVRRTATGALTDALAGLPELDVWADAGLAARLRRGAPAADERCLAWCTCRRGNERSRAPG